MYGEFIWLYEVFIWLDPIRCVAGIKDGEAFDEQDAELLVTIVSEGLFFDVQGVDRAQMRSLAQEAVASRPSRVYKL